MSEPTPIESDDDDWYWNGEDLVRFPHPANGKTSANGRNGTGGDGSGDETPPNDTPDDVK